MFKKICLMAITVVCIAALAACSASTAGAGSPASDPAAPSSAATASAAQSASPSASASDTSLTGAGVTLEDIIKEDSLNKNLASFDELKKEGESIEAAIQGNTLTFYVTLEQDIVEADLTPALKEKYTAEMKSLIDTLDVEYEGFPDCTFVYNLMNQSGDTLLTLTQDYTEQ